MKRIFVPLLLIFLTLFLAITPSASGDLGDLIRNGNSYYRPKGPLVDGIQARGFDISSWQKAIDWDVMEGQFKDGVFDFVIIRCGYGDDEERYDDKRFKEYADNCTRIGIPFGVYFFSYANSVEEAQSEVSHTLRLVAPYTLSYPIFYDVEDEDTIGATDDALFLDIITTYFNGIKAAGYEIGIYASRYWISKEERLGAIDYDYYDAVKWVAEYNGVINYNDGFDIWQATSIGTVDGVTTNIDVDYCFMPKRTVNHCYVTFNLNTDKSVKCDTSPMYMNKGTKFGYLPEPTSTEQKFLGWYTSPTGGKKVTASTKLSTAGKLVLYAHWGEGTTEEIIAEGEAPSAPDKSLFTVIEPMRGYAYAVNGLSNTLEYRINGGEWQRGLRIRFVTYGDVIEIRKIKNGTTPSGESLFIYINDSSSLTYHKAVNPTCVSEGRRAYYTDKNGNVFQTKKDYFGTSLENLTVKATGVHKYEYKCSENCTVCGFHRDTEHTWNENYTPCGNYHTHACAVCGQVSDKIAHNPTEINLVAVGCTVSGIKRTVCLDCGTIISGVNITAYGHNFDDGVCQNCGMKEHIETEETTVTETEETEETTETEAQAEKDDEGEAIVPVHLIAVISAFVLVTICVIIIIVLVRKKK